jgi:hypothetical protein
MYIKHWRHLFIQHENKENSAEEKPVYLE